MTTTKGCERVQGRLERLLDEGLTSIEAARDRGHLEVCARCQAEEALWKGLLEGARTVLAPDPEELAREIAALLPRLEPAAPSRLRALLARPGFAPLATAAAALLLLTALGATGMIDGTLEGLSPRDLLPRWDIVWPRLGGLGR